MRLFTGIDLPDPIKERLDVLISHLRTAAHVKWSPVYNLHITTKFIGEWPEPKLPELIAKLEGVRAASPVTIDVNGLGWLPNARQPRVFYADIKATESLAELARATDDATAGLGVAREDRTFRAHLTLARIKDPTPLGDLRETIAKLESVSFGSFTAPQFHLYRSQPGPSGSLYTKLYDFPLPTA